MRVVAKNGAVGLAVLGRLVQILAYMRVLHNMDFDSARLVDVRV